MSEERFTRIDGRLDALQAEMRTGFAELTQELLTSQDHLRQELLTSQDHLRQELLTAQDQLRQELKQDLKSTQDLLRHEMRILHEQTRDDIRALAPDFRPIRREFQQADADLHEAIDRRLTPLEAWARSQGPKRE